MYRVEINPALYRWAVNRARLDVAGLEKRFPSLPAWEAGDAAPTLKQLEAFAAATHAPVGYFFLPDAPTEQIPIPDFRTVRDQPVGEPSADLLDTIYACQQRQEWYADFMRSSGEDPLEVVGAVRQGDDVVRTASMMTDAIGFSLAARERMRTWGEALSQFIGLIEEGRILVMVNGVVENNTHRKLDPDEFRGFAIADQYAPLIFVNGADTKSGQMFTLAHELAHIWAGQSALGDAEPSHFHGPPPEQWCNQVAAEFLVPIEAMRLSFDPNRELSQELTRLARQFKVSTLVVLRRIHDVGGLSREAFWEAYEVEVDRLRELGASGTGGGNFHLTEAARVSRRFARALVASAVAGQTNYRDAFRLLGFSKMETLHNFGRSLGVIE